MRGSRATSSDKLGEELSPRSRRIRDHEQTLNGGKREDRVERDIEIEREGERKRRRQSASARDPLDTRATHRSTVPQPLPSTRILPPSPVLLPPPSSSPLPSPPLPLDRPPHPLLTLLLREPLMLCPSIRRRLHPLSPLHPPQSPFLD